MRVKKIIGIIHLWLGLTSGLVVFILGITGSIYAFQTEIKDLVYSDRYFVKERSEKVIPISQLKEKAQRALGKEYPITFLHYAPHSNNTYRFRASKLNQEAITYFGKVIYNKTAYVNPYTGNVQCIENTRLEFFNLILQLHYDLLLNKIGHQIVAYSTLVFIVLLITGIILWWPVNKVALKQRLAFKWKSTTNWKRKNYDLHNIPGFYSMLLALCIALTGLWFGLEWFRTPVKWIANGGNEMKEEKKVFSDTTKIASIIQIDIIEQNIINKSLDAGFYYMTFPEAKDAPIVVTAMHNKNNFVKRSLFFFDKYTGKELKNKPYSNLSSAEKFIFMIYDIHVGKIVDLPGQILAFIAALIAASLPVTGFWIWWGRMNKKSQGRKSRVTSKEAVSVV